MKVIETIDIGEDVMCDWCGDDYTNSEESGGITFGSKACCPACEGKVEASAINYGETHLLGERCPEGMSFKNWVLKLRGGDNTIRIVTF